MHRQDALYHDKDATWAYRTKLYTKPFDVSHHDFQTSIQHGEQFDPELKGFRRLWADVKIDMELVVYVMEKD